MSRQRTRRELDKSFDAMLADATLHRIFAAEDAPFNNGVEVWELRAKTTWSQFVFRYGPRREAQQIIVTGDFVGDNNGWISEFGYSIGWFARQKGANYLCSKFIRRAAWVPERAADQLLDMALEELREIDEWVAGFNDPTDEDRAAAVNGARGERFRKLDAALLDHEEDPDGADDVCRSAEAFYRFLDNDLEEDDPGEIASYGYGYGYAPDEAACLCAIQRRFSALYVHHPEGLLPISKLPDR